LATQPCSSASRARPLAEDRELALMQCPASNFALRPDRSGRCPSSARLRHHRPYTVSRRRVAVPCVAGKSSTGPCPFSFHARHPLQPDRTSELAWLPWLPKYGFWHNCAFAGSDVRWALLRLRRGPNVGLYRQPHLCGYFGPEFRDRSRTRMAPRATVEPKSARPVSE